MHTYIYIYIHTHICIYVLRLGAIFVAWPHDAMGYPGCPSSLKSVTMAYHVLIYIYIYIHVCMTVYSITCSII